MGKINNLNVKEMLAALEISLENKYGYSWELASEICVIAESIIQYYGVEYANDIINAVMNCRVEILSKPTNDISAFKYKDGMYVSNPIIENGTIVNVDKKIVLPPNYNFDNQAYRGMLLNQMLKLVRSYNNEFRLTRDTLQQREGFKITTHQLKDDKLLNISEKGIGYEVGSLDNTELTIMLNEFDSYFELPGGNDYERIVAGFLEDTLGLKEITNAASINGNLNEYSSEFQLRTGYSLDEFLNRIDILHELENKRKNSKDDNTQKEVLKELEEYFRTQVAPMMQAMSIHLDEAAKKRIK